MIGLGLSIAHVAVRGAGPPSWVLSPAPALDIDFVNNRVYGGNFASIDAALTCVRAAPATTYAETVAGTLTSFGVNTLRRTDKGLLVEEARTNLALRSQELDNAAWSKNNTTISANAVVAPDGTTTADSLIETAAAGTTHTATSTGVSVSSGVVHTWTVYAKPAGRSWLSINAVDSAHSHRTWFNVSTGAVGTVAAGAAASIEALSNGWYRCQVTLTTDDTTIHHAVELADADGSVVFDGDGVSGIHLWGAQLEAGAFATSYIPTTTVAVTRAIDGITAAGALLSAFQQAAWSAVIQTGILPAVTGQTRLIGTDPGQNALQTESATKVAVWDNAAALYRSVTIGSGSYTTTPVKSGLSRDAAGNSLVGNGGAVSAGLEVLTNPSAVYLGSESAAGNCINGYITRLTVWTTRLPNATLQSLTV